jgi:uncharacterized protein (UPF0276 family)
VSAADDISKGASFAAPKLGVGMIFSPALMPWLTRRPGVLDLLEIEPQTLWLADDPLAGPFRPFQAGIDLFAALPGHKLVHSVSLPLGGTRAPDPAQAGLIRAAAERLGSPWVSEHLSVGGTPHRAAGFFLPPLQTEATAETAAANIRAFAAMVGRPVAVETGVAYLKRQPFEMDDGAWIARVVELAGCGLLLDLHNLYCNARNGRIDLDRTLAQLPLSRVWEVHLAGGDEQAGVWLDSHSGPMPPDLAALAREVVASLPNLGALTFELYETYVEEAEDAALDGIVAGLRDLWAGAGQARSDAPPARPQAPPPGPAPDPAEWEAALTEAVWRNAPALFPDDGVGLYTWLSRSFRGSMIARSLPRSIRYLLLRDGEGVQRAFDAFMGDVPPQLYAPLEAEAFAGWLSDDDPLLLALLAYDLALLRLVRTDAPVMVSFPGDPAPVFEALAALRLPVLPAGPPWEIEILPDAA